MTITGQLSLILGVLYQCMGEKYPVDKYTYLELLQDCSINILFKTEGSGDPCTRKLVQILPCYVAAVCLHTIGGYANWPQGRSKLRQRGTFAFQPVFFFM